MALVLSKYRINLLAVNHLLTLQKS